MSQMQGMDPTAVRTLARQLDAAGNRLPQIARDLDGFLARSTWQGVDADDFRRMWTGSGRVRLLEIGGQLGEIATKLGAEADEQERASESFGPGGRASFELPDFGRVIKGTASLLDGLWDDLVGGWEQVSAGARDLWEQVKEFGEGAKNWVEWLIGPDGPTLADLTAMVPGLQGAMADAMDFFMTTPQLRWLADLVGKGAGFEYVEDGDFYTTNEHSVQSYLGFHDLYDKVHKLGGMDLYDKVVEVTGPDGREYRLELWKGGYGSGAAFGGEIGLYVRDPNQGGLQGFLQRIPGFYPTAQGGDQIRMVQEIYNRDTGEVYFVNDNRGSRDGDHFWNLAIRTEAGVDKSTLGQRGTLYFNDPQVAGLMSERMRAQGLKVSVGADGKTVTYDWEGS